MSSRRHLVASLVVVVALAPGTARCELIDQGPVTLDTDTGLEWLDVSETVGVSPRDIIVGGYGGLAAQGWTHATLDQIQTLFEHAGLPMPYDGTQTSGGFPGADRLLELLGSTGATSDSRFIQAFSGTASEPGGPPFKLYTPVVIASFASIGGADLDGAVVPSNVNNPTIANWLMRQAAAGPLQVVIDVKPGSETNPVNPRSNGLVPVAVLTTDAFDAPARVDPATVRFGPGLAAPAHARAHFEDVDGDWDLDLVFHFRTPETGIQCGDTEVALVGETWEAEPFEGWSAIVTVACRPQNLFTPREVRPPVKPKPGR